MADPGYITWHDDSSKESAFEAAHANIKSYQGIMSSTASSRQFIDIETNRSVRNGYGPKDYYNFRPNELPRGRNYKENMAMANQAYKNVGIIKNIIDLMADFGSQGITIVHESKAQQKFYRSWWNKVQGTERSERFLNNLFRLGQTVFRRREGKLSAKVLKSIAKKSSDVKVEVDKVRKGYVPCVYDILNPIQVEVEDPDVAMMTGNFKYKLRISSDTQNMFEADRFQNYRSHFMGGSYKHGLKKEFIPLPSDEICVYHYKKDDWQLWADPMIMAIMDDIIMLEKMKLADMSALDGAISNIRLWSLGDLEHKILPTAGAINRLRDILASNVGGGTMDLVWGPELSFTESNTQIYKFLGQEKYEPVLSSIYAGIGVPPTLTGIAGQSGGFTNNFISLKTLVQRLEYGRDLLIHFWNGELKRVQRAMGFRKPAEIRFEHMALSDEGSEKNLLIQLADRNIISHESLCEHFGEKYHIETSRLGKEEKAREQDKMPEKASPYHKPGEKQENRKMDRMHKHNMEMKEKDHENKQKEIKQNGRPPNSTDKGPRKKRVDQPRSKPGVALVWAMTVQDDITKLMTPPLLAHYDKKNVRSLTKAQAKEMEMMKFNVLMRLNPMSDVNEETVLAILKDGFKANKKAEAHLLSQKAEFLDEMDREPVLAEIKQMQALTYIHFME